MVLWIILAVYFLYRWSERSEGKPRWIWSILAGFAGGLAVLTKFPAIYLVGGAAVAMVFSALGARRFWRSPQVWAMAALMLGPALLFYLGRQGRASEYFQDWTISLSHLLLQPGFYGRWFNLAQELIGLAPLLAALAGVIIAHPRLRSLLIGLWLGYVLYGMFYPYQLYTHSYYHLQLVPIVALSLAPLSQAFLDVLAKKAFIWKIIFVGIFLVGILFPSWQYILEQSQQDFRSEPPHWQAVAADLPSDGKIIALTQDYGYRLNYYGWRKVSLWPNRGEIKLSELRGGGKEFDTYFDKNTQEKDYFLITAFKQFQDQPDLQQHLAENYPVLAEGDGYLIYDLRPSP
jgi:4-amino-4-deoxy-L-arabinose transferase-like glycosyltransferase